MNADKVFVSHPNLSVFIGGQLQFRVFCDQRVYVCVGRRPKDRSPGGMSRFSDRPTALRNATQSRLTNENSWRQSHCCATCQERRSS